MSGISRAELERIADLAALELDPAQLAPLAAQLARILEYVARLDAVSPTADADDAHAAPGPEQPLRPDQPAPAPPLDPATFAPAFVDGFFVVPSPEGVVREAGG